MYTVDHMSKVEKRLVIGSPCLATEELVGEIMQWISQDPCDSWVDARL